MPGKRVSMVEDVTDARVVKALAHPIRVAALALLEDRVLSPKDVAQLLDVTLPLASYHVRQLEHFGLIELVRTAPRRGTLQHFYRARAQPKVSDLTWGVLPRIVKREMVASSLTQATAAMATAATEGGFDRTDVHASRTSLDLDEQAWKQLAELIAKTLERVEQIQAEAAQRLSTAFADDVADADEVAGADDLAASDDALKATFLLMLFEGPYATNVHALNESRAAAR